MKTNTPGKYTLPKDIPTITRSAILAMPDNGLDEKTASKLREANSTKNVFATLIPGNGLALFWGTAGEAKLTSFEDKSGIRRVILDSPSPEGVACVPVAGVRMDRKSSQYVPTLDGKDLSPTSFDEDRALRIAQEAATAPSPAEPVRLRLHGKDQNGNPVSIETSVPAEPVKVLPSPSVVPVEVLASEERQSKMGDAFASALCESFSDAAVERAAHLAKIQALTDALTVAPAPPCDGDWESEGGRAAQDAWMAQYSLFLEFAQKAMALPSAPPHLES